jgi:hypothetical protein
MTVSAVTPRVSYAGDGTTVAFAVPFTFQDAADLVAVTTTANVPTTLALGPDYSVTGGGGSSGTLTCVAAPASGTTLQIFRRTAQSQVLNLQRNDAFPAESLETAVDRLTRQVQDLQDQLNRCVKFGDGETSAVGTLGSVAARASKLLGFTASGGLDYQSPGSGSGSFLGLPTTRTLAADDVVLVQTNAGKGGVTTFFTTINEIQNAPYQTATYPTSTTLSTGDSGKVIKSTGQASNIVYTLPAGATGLFYVIHCDSDTYTVNLDPNGSERISYGGANKSLTMLTRGWLVIQWDGGRWEITEAAGIYEIEP